MSSNPATTDTLVADNVEFRRMSRPVLSGASLALAQGEIVCLLGCNGAGKTTLLKVMLGILRPYAGAVVLNGQDIAAVAKQSMARKLAYVPQLHQPHFPYLVRDVVALGRFAEVGLFGRLSRADRDTVSDVLDMLDIVHLSGRPYTQLSGGERQLVVLARALAQGAKLLVLDEPLTGLDYGHQIRMMERLSDFAAKGYGILMTTHHPDYAAAIATRVAALIDGRIDIDGPADKVMTPETIFRLYGVKWRGCNIQSS
jgi:iron complex transport system ATP-binding protein